MPKAFRIKRRTADLIQILTMLGGDAALARELGITRQAVEQWDCIPAGRVAAVRKLKEKHQP